MMTPAEREERRELGRVLKQTIDVYRNTGTRRTADQVLTDRIADSAESAIANWLGEALVDHAPDPVRTFLEEPQLSYGG